jgi:hypothetical protein
MSFKEKESIVEKLWVMEMPISRITDSPMIGKAVRHFYRKMAPKQIRAWTIASKVYQEIRKKTTV